MAKKDLSVSEKRKITVQSLAQLVPFGIGAALATAWSGVDIGLRFKRLEQFCKSLAEKVQQLGSDTFRGIDLHSEEFNSLMLSFIEKIEREHRVQKIVLFRDYLINILRKGDVLTYEKKKFFLETLDEVDDIHIVILKKISEAKDRGTQGATIMRELVEWNPKLGEQELETKDDYFISAALEKLDSLKLIITTHIDGMVMVNKNRNANRNYILTPLGREFVNFVLQS